VRYGSVCSGIEAATAAWHGLGWKPSFFSEIEAFPCAVLQHHYPDVPLHGDFTTIKGDEYEPIDLLVGGTPCQSFSIAGLRGGLDDDRGNLALEFLRLAQRTRPKWLVWENVPGVLSSNGGRDFGSIIGGMVEIGYGIAYRVLDAQYFGVAQRRRRVFVVGCLGNAASAAAVLFERQSLQGHPAPSREKREGSPGYTSSSFGEYREGVGTLRAQGGDIGGGSETFVAESCGTLHTKTPGSGSLVDDSDKLVCTTKKWPADVAATLNAAFGEKQGLEDQHALGGASLFVPCDVPDTLGTLTARMLNSLGSRDVEEGCVIPMVESHPPVMAGGTTTGNQGGDVVALQDIRGMAKAQNGKGWNDDGSAYTVDTMATQGVATSAVRRLTPRECERLQGFPDDFTQIPYRNKPADQCPDGPRYKALGNSMAVPVMRWIGTRINIVEQITGDNNGR
jgi:DNA (cytosine-5)-methyltransferase 1